MITLFKHLRVRKQKKTKNIHEKICMHFVVAQVSAFLSLTDLQALRECSQYFLLHWDQITIQRARWILMNDDTKLRPTTFHQIHKIRIQTSPTILFPPKIRHVYLESSNLCSFSPGFFPTTITELFLPRGFNEKIQKNVLPPSLNILCFRFAFNQPIEVGILPDSLTHLELSPYFNQIIFPHVLPSCLKHLHFPHHYSHPIAVNPRILPPSLTYLQTGKNPFFQTLKTTDVNTITIEEKEEKHLITQTNNSSITESSSDVHFSLRFLSSLIGLRMSNYFNEPLQPHFLPDNLVHLHLGANFNYKLEPNVLPPNLIALCLSDSFDQTIDIGVLPKSLTELHFGQSFNHDVCNKANNDWLPPGLISLRLGCKYTHKIFFCNLPMSLRGLTIAKKSKHLLNFTELITYRKKVYIGYYKCNCDARLRFVYN